MRDDLTPWARAVIEYDAWLQVRYRGQFAVPRTPADYLPPTAPKKARTPRRVVDDPRPAWQVSDELAAIRAQRPCIYKTPTGPCGAVVRAPKGKYCPHHSSMISRESRRRQVTILAGIERRARKRALSHRPPKGPPRP